MSQGFDGLGGEGRRVDGHAFTAWVAEVPFIGRGDGGGGEVEEAGFEGHGRCCCRR